ncbi:hypothetical protein C7C46_01415 [Streptomyces tateyamensis]|uniref:S1 motif domain-containing protein n=1 Tax=Streptomyces tateyamensis TaxID=565073 RepID=A0A2V4P0L0_9ACTN|nr:S1 RNA-binding domain-containing protein [Streptomyces tateyamensis]PYC88133.1 hypothetical protein C7C46_01415 [Streptomyces tateyamensis]
MTADPAAKAFFSTLAPGDHCAGTVSAVERAGLKVALDDFPSHPLGEVWSGDLPLGRRSPDYEVGERVTAQVMAVHPGRNLVRLSLAATAHAELWAFLAGFAFGDMLIGTIASIEPFGVFVALDQGPAHPLFPGVGFITLPELSWVRGTPLAETVQVGQQVRAMFLQFDTYNGEARLSLRGLHPDPFQLWAETVAVGRRLSGSVTEVVDVIGAFVRVADGVVGLVHEPGTALKPGDQVTVTLAEVDRERRRVLLALAD